MSIPKIKKAASEFRHSIEKCSSTLGISFEQFPLGSCGDTVPLLGTYLIKLGLGEFKYMNGSFGRQEDGTWRTHAWLQKEGLVVDITADRFPGISQKIIVQKDSEWHKSLNGTPEHAADYRVFDERTVKKLESMYFQIIDNIKKT